MLEYGSLNDYFLENKEKLGIPLQVTLDGKLEKSPLKKTKCVYYEAVTLLYKEGRLVGNTGLYATENDFYVIIEKTAKVLVTTSKIRTYIEPHFTKPYTIDEITDEERKARFTREEYEKVADVEYILQKGKLYYAMINQEQYSLPPKGPRGKPQQAHNTVIWISTKEYKDKQPQVEITPHYKNWKY